MEDEQPTREANKICGVCGDRALGYNFNAVSCESCKAFFRRNALKNKDFRCPFTENCSITPVTRRFCQKCRLDKCFNIGMRKEYIMSEEDKVLKRQKIEQNRAKKRPKLDNRKDSKIKKSCVDDNSIDDTSMSIPSVASTVSETYFWESDKKYADLDSNKRQAIDNLSPVTAASVPSPLSPLETSEIGGTKTLDMLRESSCNPSSTIIQFEQELCYRENDIKTEGRRNEVESIPQDISHINNSDCLPQELKMRQNSMINLNHNSNILKLEVDHSTYESPSIQNTLAPNECIVESKIASSEFDSNDNTNVQIYTEEPNVCQKPKEICRKENSLIAKFAQDSTLITKFLNSPNLVAKIFENQDVILKIVSEPDVANKLAADPQISQFIEENCSGHEKDVESDYYINAHVKDSTEHNGSVEDTFNLIGILPKIKQCHNKNPILTDLITSHNSDDRKNMYIDPTASASAGVNKSITDDVTKDVLQDVQRIPIAANSIESILCEAIKLEFSAYSTLGGNQSSRELNDAERAKLNELIVANKALLAPLDDDITNLVGDECPFKMNSGQSDPVLLDVINLTAIAIRRIIKMAKKINAFKNMCQEDQLALLKGGCTEMMILRSAINYDPDKDMWKIPHSQERLSNIKVDVLKEAKGNLYAEHARFVRTFDPRWRDENIILILSAIALFTPDRPRVIHSDVIKLEQNSYYYLLRRYLESVYPGCEAKSTFLKLIQKISELHRLNDEVVGVYLNVNPSSVEPLLIEIFDLKY